MRTAAGILVRAAFGLGLLACAAGPTAAQPPIQSPQDAACRDEARARVFSAPDPQGLGLHGVGRQIYAACMQRAKGKAGGARRKARRAR